MNEQSYPSVSSTRSAAATALDDLVRRQLRVSDPRDALAVSQALRERYRAEDNALNLEAAGLPFRLAPVEVQRPVQTSTSVELMQARDDVSRDLESLLSDALLKDVYPELRGWAQHIRQAVMEGAQAARFALDPWQRDQAMGTRRLLGDYARVARFVGALTPGVTRSYRALAHSLDEISSVILVTMGEAIAQAGYGGGRFLLQAPASELQARRDAVLNALRTLVGSRQVILAQGDWGYGLHALRQVTQFLDQSGMTDLRALFQENYVARTLDELVQWATRGSAEDLRALGATAQLTMGKFRRLLIVSGNIPDPQSPPLTTYLDAIRLFLDAFGSGAGYRLLYIARPAIAHYGLYGIGGPDAATQRMLDITGLRGELAQLLDCLGCSCTDSDIRCQLRLDKVLYDVDRAIDLYVMGTDPEGDGLPENRAAAYGAIIEALPIDNDGVPLNLVCADGRLACILGDLRDKLFAIADDEVLGGFEDADLDQMHQELCIQRDAELQWESLLHTLAPSCFNGTVRTEAALGARTNGAVNSSGVLTPTLELVDAALDLIDKARGDDGARRPIVTVDTTAPIPPHTSTGVAILAGIQDQQGNPGNVGTARSIKKAAKALGCIAQKHQYRSGQGIPKGDRDGEWYCDVLARSMTDVEGLRRTMNDSPRDSEVFTLASQVLAELPEPLEFPATLATFTIGSPDDASDLKQTVAEINQSQGTQLLLSQRKARQLPAARRRSSRPPPPDSSRDDSDKHE
jgi:hypothetical protein